LAEETPQDPFGPFAADAARLHEAFLSFVRVGFNEAQALYLVACTITGGPKAAP
jgi:hypothetical protein